MEVHVRLEAGSWPPRNERREGVSGRAVGRCVAACALQVIWEALKTCDHSDGRSAACRRNQVRVPRSKSRGV